MKVVTDEKGRKVMEHPSIKEMKEGLDGWQSKFPGRLKVSVPGKSLDGRDLLLCRITDYSIPDENKQTVLITCTHAGREINAATSALHFIKWLIGDSDLAAETRKKQIVIVMPACAPDAYDELRGPDARWNKHTRSWEHMPGSGNPCAGFWAWDKVLRPEMNPEAVAIAEVMETYKPEAHVDLHGLPQDNSLMPESTGISWFSGISRAHAPEAIRLIDEAADKAGFGLSINIGQGATGMVPATGSIAALHHPPELTKEDKALLADEYAAHHFFIRPPNINTNVYSYNKYHTLSFIMEIGFEQSAMVRLQRLMQIGNKKWPSEFYAGYPVNQVGHGLSVSLSSWGEKATQRRRSRVEIWNKIRQFCFGYGNPQNRGEVIALCATTPGAAKKFLDANLHVSEKLLQSPSGFTGSFENLLERMRGQSGYDLPRLESFLRRSPVRDYMCLSGGGICPDKTEPIANGLGIRVAIPYPKAEIKEVLLDGYEIGKSKKSGYMSRRGPATTLQVNIPPGKVKGLHIITCRYEPGEERPCGFSRDDW